MCACAAFFWDFGYTYVVCVEPDEPFYVVEDLFCAHVSVVSSNTFIAVRAKLPGIIGKRVCYKFSSFSIKVVGYLIIVWWLTLIREMESM